MTPLPISIQAAGSGVVEPGSDGIDVNMPLPEADIAGEPPTVDSGTAPEGQNPASLSNVRLPFESFQSQ
jgi:hypothetical protein